MQQQIPPVGTPLPPGTLGPDALAPGWPAAPGGFDWLWESVRQQFWRPTDLAWSILDTDAYTPAQREAIAYWWSLLAAIEGLGPPTLAAALVRAGEQHDEDDVRWSLMAMLRDEMSHEQLCRIAIQRLEPGWPLGYPPRTSLGRCAQRHLRQVYQDSDQFWHSYRRALDRHGLHAVTGALLLVKLTMAALYERLAPCCAAPAFAAAFRHAARDSQRHRAVLQALVARDWPALTPHERSAVTAQVRSTAWWLSRVLLEPADGRPGPAGELTASQRACAAAASAAGFGVPTAERRQELLRAALLEVKEILGRYHISCPAVPQLAVGGTQEAEEVVHTG